MTQYLFLFTIAPVQSFIAQARKTQDLYAGSFLLSHLIDIAINTLKKNKVEYELIFPAEDIKSKPNRFIAEISAENREMIEEVGKYVEGAVRSDFKNIAEKVQEKLNLYKPKYFDEQIKTHLQVNWVALPLDENDYTDTYKELERYLGAIKNVRQFDQLNNDNGELGRKCSLCGERNVKVYRLTEEEEKNEGLGKRNDGLLSKLYVKEDDVAFFAPRNSEDRLKLAKGEGLCAVCFTKRFADKYFEEKRDTDYNYTKHFPSTAEIALMHMLCNPAMDVPLKEYRKCFSKNFDAELYYEENLTEHYFKKNDYPLNKLSDGKEKIKQIYGLAKNEGLKFHKYYALILLDGDNMGKWLSGEFLENENGFETFHKELSKALGDYADKVESIIQEPKGKLVYAGGDDVMAFENLEHLFGILTNLSTKFPNLKEIKDFDNFNIKKDATASCGVVIAHYKTPLSEVLKWARKMAHEAKDKGDRDAFGIAVLKHSGEINKTVLKWNLGNYSNKITAESIKLLEDLVKELNDEKEGFSNTFIKNLNIELQKLDEVDEDILKTELGRLLARACLIKDKERRRAKVFAGRDNWRDRLFNLYIAAKNVKGAKKENFLSFLNIADFLARKVTR